MQALASNTASDATITVNIQGEAAVAEALGTLSASSQRRCNSPEKSKARKEHNSRAKPNSRATRVSNAETTLGSDEAIQAAMLGLMRSGAASIASKAAVAWL
jgi:hypothetical protein